MLSPCPLPVGRDKQPLTVDEKRSVTEKMRNVVAERRAFFKAVNELDDAKFTKRLTEANNRVVVSQKKVDALEVRIAALGVEDKAKGVRDKLANLKSESKAYDESVAAQQRLEVGIADLDRRFFTSNSEITPQMVSAYEKTFNVAKTTTDPVTLKKLDVALRQMEKAMEAEVKGITKQITELWKNREVQLRNYITQLERTRVAYNRVLRAQKKLVAEINLTDKGLAKELNRAQKQLTGSIANRDALEAVATKYNERIKKENSDMFEAQMARDEFFVKLGEAVELDPRKGKGVMDWLSSKFGYTFDGTKSMQIAANVRLDLQRAGYLAENLVNKIVDVVQADTIIKFRNDFAKAADELKLSPKQRQVLMTETIEKGQIPDFLKFFDMDNTIVKEVQRARYASYVRFMTDAGFTMTQIDEFVNGAVKISKIADDIRLLGRAMGVSIDSIEPFLGYITRIFSLDGSIWYDRIVNIAEKKGNILPVGKDAKFQFDIQRKFDYLVPMDLDLAVDIMKVSRDDLLSMIDNPLQMKLFIEKNLTYSQIDTLTELGFFQKLPMSTRDVYDYLMAQYRLPFNSAADMFNLDIVDNLKTYSRAIGDQANVSMMLNRVLSDEDGVKLGWSVPMSVYEADKLLPIEKRQFANYVKMEEKMLEWTSRLGIPADVQEQLGKFAINPVVADQLIAIIDITKSPALLGQLGGAQGWFNKLFATLKSGNLVANAPVYISNQIRGNFLQMHAAGANILQWIPAARDVWRVVRGEGLEHLDNTTKRYEVGGKQLTEREAFLEFYDNQGTATTAIFGERGKPSSFNAKDAARNLLSNSSGFVWHLMQYMFGTGELTGGKTLNSMQRVLEGVDYFSKKAGGVLNDLSAPVFYTANMVDLTAKYATFRSVAKRIDGGSSFDKAATYAFSQSAKSFDNWSDINKHLRAYFPDMRDVGSVTYGIDKYAIMYFSWQASMMPRVLRDVVRRPWRYAAYEKLRQFTSDRLSEDDSITEAGITPDIMKGMPYYIGRGRDDGKLIFWNDSSYNPTNQTFEFLRSFNNETAADRRAKLQGDYRNEFFVKALESTYAPAKIIYELASNTNLRTGKQLRRTDGRGVPLLGFEVPPDLYSVINNAVPYVGALDRLDIEGLSGVPEIRDNNNNIIQQGKAGLGGAVPDATGRVLRKNEIENNWVYRVLGTIGGNLRVVDMAKQNKITYNDVSRSLDVVTKQIDRETEQLLKDQNTGSVKNSKSYAQRIQNLEKLVITREQLQIDEDRIYLYLNERGVLTDKEIKQKERYMLQLQNQGVSPLDASIDASAKRLLRFRQEWSIPRYGSKKETP